MLRSLLLGLALSLGACQSATDPAEPAPASDDTAIGGEAPILVDVTQPFALAAPAGGTAGVFLSVKAGLQAITLVGARSAAAERVEVHESYDTDDGLRGMREVSAIPISAGETATLAPGGYHIMLLNLTRELAVGDTVDLELDFARAGAVPVRAPVMSLDAMPAAVE